MDASQTKNQSQMPEMSLEGSDVMFGEDIISNLHDSLLSYILSLMPTESAVRTSVLSKRWENVWKSVPKLELDSEDFADEDEFIDFMDRTLVAGSCFKKFSLRCELEDYDEYPFQRWFSNLIDRKVEHVEVINCLNEERLPIPGTICNCSTLTVLELYYVTLDVPEFVSLPRLKILNIYEIGFKDDSAFRTLISGCPVLEEAYITRNHWDMLDVFHISSKSLKKLCIFNMDVGLCLRDRVLIDSPSLEYLCLAGQPFEILSTNVSDSLVEANLGIVAKSTNYPSGYQHKSNNLSSAISRSTILTLSAATLHPAFARLTHLDVEFEGTIWALLPAFLTNSPNLKTLIVGWASSLPENLELSTSNSNPQCLSSSLQFFELRGYVSGRPAETNLLKYFLKFSSVLKKVTICIHHNFRFQRYKLLLLLKELRDFQRHFQHHPCQIAAVEDKNRMLYPEYCDGKFKVWA